MTAVQRASAICRREPKLPFERLEEKLGAGCCVATARMLEVLPRQVYRWRANGVPWALADVLAIRVGFHPCEVWPDWWELTT